MVACWSPSWCLAASLRCLQFVLHNSSTTLFPTDLCTEENLAAQADGLEALAQSAGSNATQIALNGTTGTFVDWAGPIPVLSPVTKVSSECGRMATCHALATMMASPAMVLHSHLALRILPAAAF